MGLHQVRMRLRKPGLRLREELLRLAAKVRRLRLGGGAGLVIDHAIPPDAAVLEVPRLVLLSATRDPR